MKWKLTVLICMLMLFSGCTKDKDESADMDKTEDEHTPEVVVDDHENKDDQKEEISENDDIDEEIGESHQVESLEEAERETGIDVEIHDAMLMFYVPEYYVTKDNTVEIRLYQYVNGNRTECGSITADKETDDLKSHYDRTVSYHEVSSSASDVTVKTCMNDDQYTYLEYQRNAVRYSCTFSEPITQSELDWYMMEGNYIIRRETIGEQMTVEYDNHFFIEQEYGLDGVWLNDDPFSNTWGDHNSKGVIIITEKNGSIRIGIPESDGIFLLGKYEKDSEPFYSFFGIEDGRSLVADGPSEPLDFSDRTVKGYIEILDNGDLLLYPADKSTSWHFSAN